MSDSPPAWHPDPSDPTRLRWWDGTQWTDHTHPMPPGGQPAASDAPGAVGGGPEVPSVYSQHPDPGAGSGYGQGGGWGQQQGWGQQGGPFGQGQRPWGGGPSTWSTGGSTPSSSSWTALRYNNRFSFTAIITGVIYVALAITTHFVLIGIVPVMSAVRAFQRKEKLAPVAAVAAGLAVVMFVLFLNGGRR